MASLAFGMLAGTPARAQTPAPAPAPPTAADSAAMERALQQADGPRRRIIEAARLKAAGAPPAPAAAPLPAPAAAAAPAPRPREPEPVVIGTLPAVMAPLPTVTGTRIDVPAAVAPLESPVLPAPLADLPPAVAAAPAALPAPRLVKMVEPEFSSRVLRRGGRALEIVVDLTIRTDGSVSDIALRPPVDVSLEPAVLEALRQWRYDAQPVDRLHSVRLVVNPDR